MTTPKYIKVFKSWKAIPNRDLNPVRGMPSMSEVLVFKVFNLSACTGYKPAQADSRFIVKEVHDLAKS